MVESAGDCVKLMETVGLVRVNEVPLTLEIVGGRGGIVNLAETPVDALLDPAALIALIWNV